MCRTTDFSGFRSQDRNSLKIKGFHVRFSGLKPGKPLPESLTLLYPPRIDESELIIDGSKIRPHSTAFVTLHRFISLGGAVFGSGELVRAGEGVRFEVYLGEERILEGCYRKDEEGEWKLECKCGIESESSGFFYAAASAEISVAVEGDVGLLSERVEMAVLKRKNDRRRRRRFDRLEVIVEEREEEGDGSDGWCCCDCVCGGSDGDESEEEVGGPDCKRMEMDMELESVRWAVDVGIWVVCLGVGYLVSKASARRLRRLRIL